MFLYFCVNSYLKYFLFENADFCLEPEIRLMPVDLLNTPIEYLKGVGPKRGDLFRKDAGVSTYYDMLTYYPFRHVDRSRFLPIAEINSENIYIQIRGKVTDVQLIVQDQQKPTSQILC